MFGQTRAFVLLLVLPLSGLGQAFADVEDASKPDVAATTGASVSAGWPVGRQFLGEAVFNPAGERLGSVGAVVITAARTVSHLILGVGDNVGSGRRDVAIPIGDVREIGKRLVLLGATKARLRALPTFEYAPPSIEERRIPSGK